MTNTHQAQIFFRFWLYHWQERNKGVVKLKDLVFIFDCRLTFVPQSNSVLCRRQLVLLYILPLTRHLAVNYNNNIHILDIGTLENNFLRNLAFKLRSYMYNAIQNYLNIRTLVNLKKTADIPYFSKHYQDFFLSRITWKIVFKALTQITTTL